MSSTFTSTHSMVHSGHSLSHRSHKVLPAKEQDAENNDPLSNNQFFDSQVMFSPNKSSDKMDVATRIRGGENELECTDGEDDALSQALDIAGGIPTVIVIPRHCVQTPSLNGHEHQDAETTVIMDECSSVGMTSQYSNDEEQASAEDLTAIMADRVAFDPFEVCDGISITLPNFDEPYWGEGMSFREYCKSLVANEVGDCRFLRTPSESCRYFLPAAMENCE